MEALSKKQWLGITAIITAGWIGGTALFERVVYVGSVSIEHTVCWLTDETPKKGDFANFSLSHALIKNSPVLITKQIACGPQDVLTKEGTTFYCNDNEIGSAKVATPSGIPYPAFEFNGVVPPGKAFVYGSHPDSFDSRYWGFIDITSAQKVIPLW